MEKAYVIGTHRSVAPEETWRRIQPLLTEAGITRVANLTGLDRIGVPVFSVTRPNSRSISVSMGKGLTVDAAKVSGAMEALECFQAETFSAPLRLGSRKDLEAHGFQTRVEGLPRAAGLPFDDHTRILWIEAAEYATGCSAWVPYEIVHTDYRLPLPPGSGRFLMSSNGLASGNNRLEAIVHGVCELIERDSTTWGMQLGAREWLERSVALESVGDPDCQRLLALFRAAGVIVEAIDVATDVAVPSFICRIADADGAAFRPVGVRRGMGCHPRREIALLRALTEAAQGRLTVISGARDDLGSSFYDEAQEEKERLAFLRSLQPGRRNFDDISTHVGESFESDLEYLRSRLLAVGCDRVLVVDVTRVGWPISAARVIVPGLEGMNDAPGYVPGRRGSKRPSAGPS